jgi:hypothetical protein
MVSLSSPSHHQPQNWPCQHFPYDAAAAGTILDTRAVTVEVKNLVAQLGVKLFCSAGHFEGWTFQISARLSKTMEKHCLATQRYARRVWSVSAASVAWATPTDGAFATLT